MVRLSKVKAPHLVGTLNEQGTQWIAATLQIVRRDLTDRVG